VGAMANLGHRLSDQAVGNILRRHHIPRAPKRKQATSWKDFIRAHMAVLVATGFFMVEMLTLRGLITLWLPKTPSDLKTQGFRSFVRLWWLHDELSFYRLFRFDSLHFSNPCCPTGGDPRASSPTCSFPKERAASLAPPPLRPALMGCVVPMLVRLAAVSRDGSARHRSPLAPPSFRLALDQKIAPPSRQARSYGEHS
jgi:hypothetical protein